MEFRPYGERAVLVQLPDRAARRGLDAALRDRPPPHLEEHVPADLTVLARARTAADLGALLDELRDLDTAAAHTPAPGGAVRSVPVVYDGADLTAVAERLGVTADEVVARHTGQVWTVEFAGFLPGFGYLLGEHDDLVVPRRDSPRTRIPRGAVALADRYTGVYPSSSPGGWQLIGHTDEVMFDPGRDPAAMLMPGVRIRFVDERGGP